ncbi:protein TILLER ANGLE CONTROL 1-like [Hibiscus syriacus]|uniref:protein TILLER ANGLE CONTROL 1-like n=1 Tax=Hibiscus syriacus TaxID=106335 RepID=UPI00192236CB|nr:protein TILLER ANGLE CONTROL 1-like [Hibiscus syriacus]
MKIFNWVQRRFNHTILKDGSSPSVKKTDGIVIDNDTKAFLEQGPLVDLLDGILTIGTFGFDPLKSSWGEQKDYLTSENDDERGEEEQYSDNDDYSDSNEEENPLMLSTFDHGFEDMTMTVNRAAEGSTNDEISTKLDVIEEHSRKVRRRTTLADLFSEDSDSSMKKKPSSLELDSDCSRKGSVRTKQGLSFAKKLIPQVGENSRPIKMLNQMMRRMLKKKIHPELEGRGNKLNKQCSKKKHEASESVYLLQQSPGAATA